jgi:polar amino acid transport system substrate-binding protein
MMRRVRAAFHQPARNWRAHRRVRRAAVAAIVLAGIFAWHGNAFAPRALASESASPAIPNFWDPSLRPEKPDMAGLRVIRFMTEDEYPPLNFQTEDGRLAGFNVDLARAVCDVLNVACTIQARRWDTLFEALKEGRGDAVIANVRPSPALRKDFAFTSPYLRTPARFVIKKGVQLDPTPEGLAGRKVAVLGGSAHEAFLASFFPKAVVVAFPDLEKARGAVVAGEADAVFADGLTLAIWLNSDQGAGCCAFAGGPYTESRYFGEGVAVAMRRNEPVLRRAVDYALQKLAEKGTFAEIYLRYFPVGFY